MLKKVTQRGYRKAENDQTSKHYSEEKYLQDEGIDAGHWVESDVYAIKILPAIGI
jgi:hypothetical protein